MVKTKKYHRIKAELIDLYGTTDQIKMKRKKKLHKELNEMYKEYRLGEYSFHDDVQQMQKQFKNNIDSFTAQKIATNLWKSYTKLLFGEGKLIHYKKFDTLYSVEGKSNQTRIRFKDGLLLWNGLNIPVKIDDNNAYENLALQNIIANVGSLESLYEETISMIFKSYSKGTYP